MVYRKLQKSGQNLANMQLLRISQNNYPQTRAVCQNHMWKDYLTKRNNVSMWKCLTYTANTEKNLKHIGDT